MEIGIIGAGDFAQAFSKRALKAGHKVKLSNSRGPDGLHWSWSNGCHHRLRSGTPCCALDNVPETRASLPPRSITGAIILIDGGSKL